MSNVIELTSENFDDVVTKSAVTVLDFSATWCAPCRDFHKVITEVAKQYPDIVFGQIDIEKQPELAADFNVRSVPLVIILREDVIVFQESGSIPAAVLTDLLEQAQRLDPASARASAVDSDKAE